MASTAVIAPQTSTCKNAAQQECGCANLHFFDTNILAPTSVNMTETKDVAGRSLTQKSCSTTLLQRSHGDSSQRTAQSQSQQQWTGVRLVVTSEVAWRQMTFNISQQLVVTGQQSVRHQQNPSIKCRQLAVDCE